MDYESVGWLDPLDFGYLFLESLLDAHLERHSGARTTGARTFESDANNVILDAYQLKVSPVRLEQGPYLVKDSLNSFSHSASRCMPNELAHRQPYWYYSHGIA